MRRKPDHIDISDVRINCSYRKVKYPRIEFLLPHPLLILPHGDNAARILSRNRDQILKRFRKVQEKFRHALKLPLYFRSSADFADLVRQIIDREEKVLSAHCRELRFRQMKRKWGLCRSTGEITLNRKLGFLPDCLIEYVVFHELLHLRIIGHNRRFRDAMARRFPDWREKEYELELYGYRMRYCAHEFTEKKAV